MGFITFQTAIKPLLLTCKIFGMSPIQNDKNVYKTSKLGIAYNITFLIIYVVGFMYVTVHQITHPESRDLLLHTITTLQNLSGFGVTMVIWISSLVNQKQYILALNKVIEIDKSFRNLGIWIYYEKIRKTSIILIICSIIYVLASLTTESRLVFEKFEVTAFLTHTLNNVPLINFSVLTIQVYTFLKMIKDRYIILNQHLKELQKFEKPSINVIEVKNFKLTSPLGTKLSLLRLICPLHHELCKAANMFDSIFGINLLVCFGNSFVAITTYMYYIISRLKTYTSTSGMEILGVMGPFTLNIIEAIWLCWICHTTIEEAQLSGILLHKIDYEEVELKQQIEMFSLQIAHENLEFSAAGFFPINFTLLYSIVGGVTTYLVILMQLSGGGGDTTTAVPLLTSPRSVT